MLKVKIPLEDQKTEGVDPDKDTGGSSTDKHRIDVETKINHSGEVNRCRAMPQSQKIIATKTTSGEVHVFDYFKHPTVPINDEVKPEIVLTGHTKEGYGLSWNPNVEGLLVSGSDDMNVSSFNLDLYLGHQQDQRN